MGRPYKPGAVIAKLNTGEQSTLDNYGRCYNMCCWKVSNVSRFSLESNSLCVYCMKRDSLDLQT